MRRVPAVFLIVLVLSPIAPPPGWPQTTEADVFVAEAIVEFDEKRYDDALANLRRALEVEPDHPEALYYLGLINMVRGRPAEAQPFLTRARRKSPRDPSIAFQLGLTYFAQQQYDQAEPLLDEVFRAQPEIDGLGYYVGFIRYRKKDYRGALTAFRSGRATDPEIQQLTRFYAGLALAVLGLPQQAAAEVEQALRLAPGSALTGPAERLRDTIVQSRQERRRLAAELRFGVFYDDNVAVVPDSNTREPLVAQLRRARHESFGELAGVRVDYSWLRDVWPSAGEAWDATVGYSFFGTYNNDVPKFNVMNHLLNTGVTYKTALGSMPAQLGGQYAWDILTLGEREFIQRHTVTAFAALVESDMHLTQAFLRYQNKQFNEEIPLPPRQEFRDADNWTLGFVHLLRFKQDAHFVKLGYQLDYDDTTGRNYAYVGNRFLVGGQYTLPWHGIRLKYDFDAHVRDYSHRNSILPSYAPGTKQRRDEELTNVVRVEVPLPLSLTVSAEYQRTMNNSNIEVFDYTRNVVSLILSWTY